MFVHHQEVCTSSLQYFTPRVFMRILVADTIDRIVSATRVPIKIHGEIL